MREFGREGSWNAAVLFHLFEFCLDCGFCSASGLWARVGLVLLFGLRLGLAGLLDLDGSVEEELDGFVLAVAFGA